MPPEAVSGLVGAAVGLVFGPTVNARILTDREHGRRFRESACILGILTTGAITSFVIKDSSPFFLAVGYTALAHGFLAGRNRT